MGSWNESKLSVRAGCRAAAATAAIHSDESTTRSACARKSVLRALALTVVLACAALGLAAASPARANSVAVKKAAASAATTVAATASPSDGFSFVARLGSGAPQSGALAGWLLPFLKVEVCAGTESCDRVVATLTAASPASERLRVEKPGEPDAHFFTVFHGDKPLAEGSYRLRVQAGPTLLGYRDLMVSSGARPGGDPYVIRPSSSLPVGFRILEQPYWGNLSVLSVEPGSAPAGSVVGLSAATSITPSGRLGLLVGGQAAPVRADPLGGFVAGVPLFFDPRTNWTAPPSGAVDLLLFADGIPVAAGRKALTITALQPAPGSMEDVRLALDGIVNAFDRIADAAALESGVQQQWLSSVSFAAVQLLNGKDPGSLASTLKATDPAARRLLDALFAGSGAMVGLQQYEQMISYVADGFDEGAQLTGLHRLAAFRTLQAQPALLSTATSDVQLAKDMQFYEVVKLFGNTVIGPTSATWGLFIGNIEGLLGLVSTVPGAQAVRATGALLSVLDFAFNKIYVGLLPARVTELELTVAGSLLAPGESTDAFLHLTAVNDPPSIGFEDFVSQILAIAGVPETPSTISTFKQVTVLFLGFVHGQLISYASDHPQLHMTTDIASMPALSWETTIHDTRLVERRSNTPTVIEGLPGAVNWKAAAGASGDGVIFARTAFGPEALLISLPPGVEYTPGAFGVDNLMNSNNVTVHVSGAPGIGVTVSPRPNSVVTGSLTQFTAGVTGTPNTAVAWSATCGEIAENGLYTAPSAAGICSVTATSVADPSSSDTANFNVVMNDVVQATILACDTGSALTCSPGHGNMSWIDLGPQSLLSGDVIAPLGSAVTVGSQDFTTCDLAEPTNCIEQSIKVELSKPTSTTVRIAIRFVSTGDLALARLARTILFLKLQTPGPGDFSVHEEGKALSPTYHTFAPAPYRLYPVRGLRTEPSLGKINPFDPKPVWDGGFGTGQSTAVLQVAPDGNATPAIGWNGTIEITLEWLGCPWPSCATL